MATTATALAPLSLARFERVNIRDVWPSESSDFTPWLSRDENIVLLGETIGLELEAAVREQHVGPFRADILCKDVLTDRWVLIENQLEPTDHSHLGQSITYAAGLNAETIVWVAASFTDEHLAAVTWLNEITDERFSFFAIEIEAWRIGSSPVAPRFHVVAKPNGWRREVARREERPAELTEGRRTQLAYWTSFKAFLDRSPGAIRIQKPQAVHWMAFPAGRSFCFLAANILLRKRAITVGLTLHSASAKEHFGALLAEREAIEREMGQPLDWLELPHRKESRIEVQRPAACDDPAAWPALHEWHRAQLELFQRVLGPRVKILDEGAALD